MTAALRGVGILAALVLAVVHGYLVPEHLEEKFYVGVLFVIGTVLLVVAIVGLVIPRLHRLHRLGWSLGAVVAAGMFVGYVLSRTVGLPGGYMEGWDEPLGTLSLIVEVVFVVAALVAGTARGGRRGAVAGG